MSRIAVVVCIALMVCGCKKPVGEPEPVIHSTDVFSRVISRDTLTSGQLWTIAIGQLPETVYANIVAERRPNRINYLGVGGNRFTNLNEIENKIGLYTSLHFYGTTDRANGIQLTFSDDKIKSIWTNSGKKLSHWPKGGFGLFAIRVGDPVSTIFLKLVRLKAQPVHAKTLENFTLLFKDLSKPYDPAASASPHWHFSATVDDKRIYAVQLNFVSGRLASVYRTLLQVVP